MGANQNKEFELQGIHQLAMVCKDMARTVDFYTNVLGMPLIKTINLPNGLGQHFFFDIGGGDCLAFFWFTDGGEEQPGLSRPAYSDAGSELISASGSMNHVAFHVPPEKIDEYRERLRAKGVKVTEVVDHDASPGQVTFGNSPSVWCRSIYFFDPDGINLEFSTWSRELRPEDALDAPTRDQDRELFRSRRGTTPVPPMPIS